MLDYDNNITNARKWTIFFVMAIGTFSFLLSASSINVALPIIEKEFSAPLSSIQWVVTAYLLMISSVLPIFGWAGDMTQRKYVIALGFAIFALGALFCAWSSTLEELVISRIIQGLGASMNMANSYAAITSVFPVQQRGKAFGMIGSAVALGSISGPAVGGLLLEWFGWHSIFYVVVPLSIIGFIMSIVYIPKQEKSIKYKKFDLVGSLLLVGAISGCIITLSQWGREGWSNFTIAILALLSIVFAVSFYYWEKKSSSPLIELEMFKNKIFLNGNLAGFCAFLTLNVSAILLPFYLHKIFDSTPKEIGMVLMVFPIMVIVAAPISGSLSDRYGAPKFAISGMAIMIVAMLLLALTAKCDVLWIIILVLALFGTGNGMFQSPNNSTTLAVIPVEKHGMAGSILALMRNFGSVMGAALAVRVFDLVIESQKIDNIVSVDLFIEGYRAAILMGAAFAFLGLLFSLNKTKNLSHDLSGEKNA